MGSANFYLSVLFTSVPAYSTLAGVGRTEMPFVKNVGASSISLGSVPAVLVDLRHRI